MLLVREGDVETDTLAAVFVGAVVGGFHNTGTTASDSSMTVLGEFLAQFTGLEAVFMVLGEPGRTKDRDALRVSAYDFQPLFQVFSIGFGAGDIGFF